MSGRRTRSPRKHRKPVVLVFGESEHDRKAILHLVRGLRSDLVVEERRRPLVLIKGTLPDKARNNAAEISQLVQKEARTRQVLAVLAHEDCDAVEPSHEAVASKIEAELTAARCPAPAIAVTPAWEMETWWLLFPEAVAKLVLGWRSPDDWLGKNVGVVRDAKEKLAGAVQPKPRPSSPPREYKEHDSIDIARNVVGDGLLASFSEGRRKTPHPSGGVTETWSRSFERFRVKVLAIG